MIRRLTTFFALLALVVATASCDVTVRVATTLERDGSGRFAIGVTLDKELREQLAEGHGDTDSLASLEGLFGRLKDAGWTVTTTQPEGGIAYEASRSFADSAGFDDLLADVGNAQEGSSVRDLGGIALAVDHDVQRGFFQTRSSFSGRIDTSGGSSLSQQTKDLIDALGQYVHFEVAATMPGSIVEQRGGGAVSDSTIVWRPRLGTALDFETKARGFNTGALLLVIIPALLLLAGVVLWVMRRRPAATTPVATTPVGGAPDDLAPAAPEPAAPVFLAIEPEPVTPLDPVTPLEPAAVVESVASVEPAMVDPVGVDADDDSPR